MMQHIWQTATIASKYLLLTAGCTDMECNKQKVKFVMTENDSEKKNLCEPKKCMQPISARYKRSTNRLSQSWFKSSRWTNVVFSIYMQFCVNILRYVCIVNSRISFMRDIITCNSRISILWDADCDMYIRSSLFWFVVFLPYTKIGHALYKWEQLLGTQE